MDCKHQRLRIASDDFSAEISVFCRECGESREIRKIDLLPTAPGSLHCRECRHALDQESRLVGFTVCKLCQQDSLALAQRLVDCLRIRGRVK